MLNPRKQRNESYREFAQTVEDLYRRAYPSNPDIVKEQALATFLDNCHESRDFRMAVKRTHPTTVAEALVHAMQEECLRTEEKNKEPSLSKIYTVGQSGQRMRKRNQRVVTGNRSDPHLN